MNRYTTKEVNEQQQRFDSFMNSTNLVKIGKTIIDLMTSNEGHYLTFRYIKRVLNLVKVKHSMYHPELHVFYNLILKVKSIEAYLNSKNNKRG